MLQQLRAKAKSFVSFALLILLVISFGIWGIGDIFRNQGRSDWVAKVGPLVISPQALDNEFRKQSAQMRAVLGPDFSPAKAKQAGMMQRSLDQIISTSVIDLEIDHLGLKVGNDPIIAMLQQTPQLRNPDGTFNRQIFERMLASQGMNEPMFLDQQRRVLARNILANALKNPIMVSDYAAETFAKAGSQRRVAEMIKVNEDKLSAPAPDDAALQEYFKAHGDNYKTTEQRSLSVLRLTPASVAGNIKISNDDIQAAYNQNHDQFEQPEKRDIVQAVTDNEAKAKELAAAAHKSGLQTAAKDAKADAVPLTQLTKKDLPEALANAVFAQSVGAIGGPIQTNLGWHVFVVEKITPARKQSRDEVNAALKAKLQADKAADALVGTANKIDDMLAGGKKLEDIAASFGLKLEKEENIQADDKNLPSEILKAGFQENEGETSPLMESKDKDGGYLLVRADKVSASHVQDFADVKDKLKADWQKEEKEKKASEILAKAVEQLKKDISLGDVSGEALAKTTSQPVRVDDWQQTNVPREALAPLFDLGKGETATVTTKDGEVLVRVKTILPGTDKDVEARKAAAKEHLAQEWLGLHLEELDKALRVVYPVRIEQKTLDRMASEN